MAGLLRFAYLVTGSQHAAEDAVQEALTSACAKWAGSRGPATPRRTCGGWSSTRTSRAGGGPGASRRSPRCGRRRTPTRRGRDRHGDAVWRVCEALPRQQRAAVVLRFYEDLDYPEIAAILGVAEPTVRSHVHRALAALRTELTQPDEGDER